MDTADAGTRRALLLMRGLRAGLLLACLVVAGTAWVMKSQTIMLLAIVIAAEEAWETSVVVAALRHQLSWWPPSAISCAPYADPRLAGPADGC